MTFADSIRRRREKKDPDQRKASVRCGGPSAMPVADRKATPRTAE